MNFTARFFYLITNNQRASPRAIGGGEWEWARRAQARVEFLFFIFLYGWVGPKGTSTTYSCMRQFVALTQDVGVRHYATLTSRPRIAGGGARAVARD